jgi:hypothetical protein
VLAGGPSLEVRRRIEGLLEKAAHPVLPSERLRPLRAVEVLERTGTDDARAILKELASGMPEARLTEEARAALGRLGSAAPERGARLRTAP